MIEVITAFLLVLSMSVFVAHAFDAYRTTAKGYSRSGCVTKAFNLRLSSPWRTALIPPQGRFAPAVCAKWNVKEETRDGSKTTIKREDFTNEQVSPYSSRPLFRMSRI